MTRLASSDLAGPKGHALARKAIEAMESHKVAPTAINYELWLAYVMDAAPDLRRQIDATFAQSKTMADSVSEALHEQYFGGGSLSHQLILTGERIAKEMAEVVAVLQAAGDQTSAFGGTLTSATAKLDQGLDPNALRDLMAGLAAATKEMAANNKALTDKLEETGREVVQIRASLEAARAEALTDALTGIGNRKAFDQTLQMRVDEALGTRTDLCLMLCDIDHFKKFNDTWGHQIGDQVIRFVAATLKRSALGDMLAARYGGEEFGLVMPRMKLGGARELAEFIRKQVESKALVRKSTGEDLGRISISIGLAQLRGNETVASLVERADECLYASKRGGRNRVTTDADQITLALG